MVENIIKILNNFSCEHIILLEITVLFSLLSLFSYFFRKNGIYAFIIITMIVANIQVLKIVEFSFYPEPIALGKIAICFTFLASDILAECFGKKCAYTGVYLGFFSNMSLMVMMIITLGYHPLHLEEGINIHEHLKIIFMPVPGIFIAGCIAFVLSQALDITIFLKLKEKFNGRLIWLRVFISSLVSSFFDNIIFYSLALYIFNNFVSFKTLVFSYILGTLFLRAIIISLSSFVFYIIKSLLALPEINIKYLLKKYIFMERPI